MNHTTTLSVVIPVYLGENVIEELVDRLCRVLQGITGQYEIVLVNDASPDNTWEVLEGLARNNRHIQVICLAENIGQHAAISVGILHANGQHIAIMDCDLQDMPEELPKLWEKAQEGFDIVLARRMERKDSPSGQCISWIFHQVLSLKRGIKTDPAIANYVIYSHKVMEQYRSDYQRQPTSVFYGINYLKGFSLTIVDTIHGTSARGYSGYTISKLFSLAFSLLFPGRMATRPIPFFRISKGSSFTQYGVTLRKITQEKTETIRQWRNHPSIGQYMYFKAYITPEMQQEWFKSVNNEFHSYSIIEYDEKEIGVSNIKDIDYTNKTAETGTFIYNSDYLNSDIPIRASLCGLNYCFDILRLESLKAHILAENNKAIRYNKALGFKLNAGQEEKEHQLYTLTRDDYYICRNTLSELLIENKYSLEE